MIGSLRDYARHRKQAGLVGVSLQAVQRALSSGRISRLRDGRIDFEKADEAWKQNTNQAQQRVRAPAAGGGGGEKLADAQARKETALANLREQEFKVREGQLLKREEVRQAVSRMISASRARLLMVGDELCDRLAACSDPVGCRVMVDERIHQALTELAEYPVTAEAPADRNTARTR